MTDVLPEPARQKPSRYTISELLELSQQFKGIFDLSKFTYDAARAGVVPSLGDCAVVLRRSSGNQRSSHSTNCSDIMDNRSLRPEQLAKRHPSLPPVESRAQKDDGFAKFLKKHSSPTHQRVTAGGRIVPMERKAPPYFAINGNDRNDRHDTKSVRAGENTTRQFPLVPHPGASEHGLSSPPAVQESMTVVPSIEPTNGPFAAITGNHQIAAPQMIGDFRYANPATMPDHVPLPLLSPIWPGVVHLPLEQQIYHTVQPPLAGPYQYSPSFWFYNYMNGAQTPENGYHTGLNLHAQQQQGLQHSLAQQMAVFEDLDRQLKLMDRHRAMTTLDPSLVEQRKMVVEQRAEAKEQITYLKSQLESPESGTISPPVVNATTGQGLNVWAPAYIPTGHSLSTTGTEAVDISQMQKMDEQCTTKSEGANTHKPKRKPLQIVLPPPSTKRVTDRRTHSAPITEAQDQFEERDVDGWGVQVGNAPISIKKEQSVLSDSLSSSGSEASPNAGRDSAEFDANVFTDAQNVSINDSKQSSSVESGFGLEPPNWVQEGEAGAPANVESFYEQQMDALRLPAGTVSQVQVSKGAVIEIPGQNLQPQSPDKMTLFERDYWKRKPTTPQADNWAKDKQGRHHQIVRRVTPLTGSLTVEEQNLNIPANLAPSRNEVHALAALQDVVMKNRSGKNASTQTGGSLRESDNARATVERDSWGQSSQTSNRSMLAFPNTCNTLDHNNSGWVEALNSKGQSSVFLERRHVLAPFPPNIDGSLEASRASFQMLLARNHLNQSPRLIHKRVGDTTTWYGPYYRDVRQMGLRNE